MAQKEAVNTFTGGMVMDTHPLTTPNNVLTNCLNGTLVTFNGNEMILQNDLGNAKIESKKNGNCVKLPEGFVPVGITEKGGIIYVASYNPDSKQGLLGSFPSPETNFTSDENGQGNKTLEDLFLLDSTDKHGLTIPNIYNFTSYPNVSSETPYANGTVKIIGFGTHDFIDYTKVEVISNTIEEFVGRTFFIESNATANGETRYQLCDDDFISQPFWVTVSNNNSTTYYALIRGSYKLDLSDLVIKTGDLYKLEQIGNDIDLSADNKGYTVKLIATTDRNEQVIVAENGNVLLNDLVNYNNKSGKFSLLFTPEKPETFNVSYSIQNDKIIINCDKDWEAEAIICHKNIYRLTNDHKLEFAYNSDSDLTYTFEIYPLGKFGNSYVKEMKQTLSISLDPSKQNTVDLSKWKYNVKDDRLLLQYGFKGQFNDTVQQKVKLTLVDYADFDSTVYEFTSYPDETSNTTYAAGTVETTGNTKTFNSVEYTEVEVKTNTVAEFVGQKFYIASNATTDVTIRYLLYNVNGIAQDLWVKIQEPETLDIFELDTRKEYNLPTRESSLGTFYEYIYFEDSKVTATTKLKKNRLYAVKIEFTNESSEGEPIILTEYRWLYTCPVFNEDYEEGAVDDFDNLNLNLNVIPEFAQIYINPDNESNTEYKENLINLESDVDRRGVTKNTYTYSLNNLSYNIKLENSYDGLFKIDNNFNYSPTNYELKDFKTKDSDDIFLKPYYGEDNSSNNLSDIYDITYIKLKNNISIENNSKIVGTIYSKIYASRTKKNFQYSCVIAPLVYDNDSLRKYNLLYDSNKRHFINDYFVLYLVKTKSDDDQSTSWQVSPIVGVPIPTPSKPATNEGHIYQALCKLEKYITNDTYTDLKLNIKDDSLINTSTFVYEDWQSDITDSEECDNNKLIISLLLQIHEYSTLVPMIIVHIPGGNSINYSLNGEATLKQVLSGEYEKILAKYTWKNGLRDYVDDMLISWGDDYEWGTFTVTLQCKDDRGNIIPLNVYNKIGKNNKSINYESINVNNNKLSDFTGHTFADIIFNILNQIYVKYESGTDAYSKFSAGYIYILDNIKYIENDLGQSKLNIKGNITSENPIVKINNKSLDTILGNLFNLNNLKISNNSSFSFDKDVELIFTIKNKLIEEYEKLSNQNPPRYKFVSSTFQINESDIENFNTIDALDLSSPLIITKDKDLVNWKDIGYNYCFDLIDTEGWNTDFKVSRNLNKALILPKALIVNENKELRLKESKYIGDKKYLLDFEDTDYEYNNKLQIINIPEELLFSLANTNISELMLSKKLDITKFAYTDTYLISGNTVRELKEDVTPDSLKNDIKLNNYSIFNTIEKELNCDSLDIKYKLLTNLNASYSIYNETLFNSGNIYVIKGIYNESYTSDLLILFKDEAELIITKEYNNEILPKLESDSTSEIIDKDTSLNVTSISDSNDPLYEYLDYNGSDYTVTSNFLNFKLRYFIKPTSSIWGKNISIAETENYYTFTYEGLTVLLKLNLTPTFSSVQFIKTSGYDNMFFKDNNNLMLKGGYLLSDILNLLKLLLKTHRNKTCVVDNSDSTLTNLTLTNSLQLLKYSDDNWVISSLIEDGDNDNNQYRIAFIYGTNECYTDSFYYGAYVIDNDNLKLKLNSITTSAATNSLKITLNLNMGEVYENYSDIGTQINLYGTPSTKGIDNFIDKLKSTLIFTGTNGNITPKYINLIGLTVNPLNSEISFKVSCGSIITNNNINIKYVDYYYNIEYYDNLGIHSNNFIVNKDWYVTQLYESISVKLTTLCNALYIYYIPKDYITIYKNSELLENNYDTMTNPIGQGHFEININCPILKYSNNSSFRNTLIFNLQ